MPAVTDIGFGQNDDGFLGGNEAWKVNEGKYRVSVIGWPKDDSGKPKLDAPSPAIKAGKRVWVQGVGKVLYNGPEFAKFDSKGPRSYFVLMVVVWPVDSEGVPNTAKIKDGKFDVVPWVVPEDKYKQLRSLHGRFHFGSHDIAVDCTDKQYQKMTFQPEKSSLYNQMCLGKEAAKFAKHVAKIHAAEEALAPMLSNQIGSNLTVAELLEKLNGVAGSGGSDTDLGGGGGGSTVDEDVDNLLGDILQEDSASEPKDGEDLS